MVEVSPIQNICETLEYIKMFPTIRKAQSAVKKGEVYIEDIRVANVDALLVISGPTRIRYQEEEVIVQPWTR